MVYLYLIHLKMWRVQCNYIFTYMMYVTYQESTEYADQVVCQQYQRGYSINDRLVFRPQHEELESGEGENFSS